jgi:hypothetical protein
VGDTYLREFLAVFFLFKLLPVPINFDILLVRSNDFILNFVGTLLALLLLIISAVIFFLIDLSLNFGNRPVSLSAHLLNLA